MNFSESNDVVMDTDIMEKGTDHMLSSLPNLALTTIMECVVRCSNPGQVIKLALVCRALLTAVVEAEGLWEQLSISHGWSPRPTDTPYPLPELPMDSSTNPSPQRSEGEAVATASPSSSPAAHLHQRWFHYYSRRMICRRRVRRFFRLYTAFLSRPSCLALMPGADPAALSTCEQRLGVPLPWELWELYRFRNGQAPAGPFVTFVDDMRLLAIDELVLERHCCLPELRQRLARMGQLTGSRELPRPAEGSRGGGSGGSGSSGGQQTGNRAPACAEQEALFPGGPSALLPSQAPAAVPTSATTPLSLPPPRPPDGFGTSPAPDSAATIAVAATTASTASAAVATATAGNAGCGGGSIAGPAPAGTAGAGAGDPISGAFGGGTVAAAVRSVSSGGSHDDCGDERLLLVASNPSSSRRFLVALDGQVYLARGMLSLAFFAPSASTMIQKLLQ